MYPETTILGIRIHKISYLELEKEIVSALTLGKRNPPLFIATVNPSFIVRAQRDANFKDILNNRTTINVADGVGLKLADRGLEIITGISLTTFILSKANELGKSVLIIVREKSLTTRCKLEDYLRTEYPNLRFEIASVLSSSSKHDVLLCTLGEGDQERFIAANMDKIESKVSMGIGGAFDVLTGAISIPTTKYFNWFFRLVNNPKRIVKIANSVLVFPLMLLLSKLRIKLND